MCAPNNEIKVTILDDGSVKIETGTFEGAKHSAAEAMLRDIGNALGKTTRTRAPHAHHHHHEHDHDHEHEGNK